MTVEHLNENLSATQCYTNCFYFQGDHSFRKSFSMTFPWLSRTTEMNFHDPSALHVSQNKRNMTYKCIPELVVTVPAGCSSTAKDDNQWKLSTHSLLTFITEFLSAVVKISRHYAWLFHDFSMDFHDFPGFLSYAVFYDFPGPVVTLYITIEKLAN